MLFPFRNFKNQAAAFLCEKAAAVFERNYVFCGTLNLTNKIDAEIAERYNLNVYSSLYFVKFRSELCCRQS